MQGRRDGLFEQLLIFHQFAVCGIRQLAVIDLSLNKYGQAPLVRIWLIEVEVDATHIGRLEDVYANSVRANKPAGIWNVLKVTMPVTKNVLRVCQVKRPNDKFF